MVDYLLNKPKDVTSYVRISSVVNLYYGWVLKDLTALPNVSAADLAALGHIAPNTLPNGALTVFRTSSPKPGTVRKRLVNNPSAAQQEHASTFYAQGALQAAIAAGWKLVKPPRKVSLTKNNRTTTAIASLSNGLLYAFPMNTNDFELYKATLGLIDSTTINTPQEEDSLISGTRNPRPGKAQLKVPGGGKRTAFYTSGQETVLGQNGWSIISREIVA
ncbi:hypothetical protein Xen7305DRAFT_00046540 [Xenococcus sp. PCC 7305]|uniref:hypothetical protein n=1 Tax=Xenococcus sp. PCC 7305 TaxID=102125 RepID=UPI0002ACFB5B|nr:hypothetical protein [Xenococcus sp. PCC 7305]ELS04918.1 hypothetical protein Xen7305DRAFT_00046540 [Xenococcus sp. PCC 7305]